MLAAAQQTAAVTLTASADATDLVNLRRQYKAGTADRAARIPSYTDLLVKLAAAALERHPAMLGQWADNGIFVSDGVHVAVAVDTPFGLLTPVLRDVPALSLAEVSERLASLISPRSARRLSADELRGGTFTVTNLGGYRVDAFTPLLNLPQTAILGVGRISPQPVAVEGRVEVRDRVTLSLTFDHRVVDGATAAALLTTICELVEKSLPTLLSSPQLLNDLDSHLNFETAATIVQSVIVATCTLFRLRENWLDGDKQHSRGNTACQFQHRRQVPASGASFSLRVPLDRLRQLIVAALLALAGLLPSAATGAVAPTSIELEMMATWVRENFLRPAEFRRSRSSTGGQRRRPY